MMVKKNSEQDKINKERLVDIVLIIQYMKDLDVDNEFFTDQGIGFLKGLASAKDEIKFVSNYKYDEICKSLTDASNRNVDLEDKNIKLKNDNKEYLKLNNQLINDNLELKDEVSKLKYNYNNLLREYKLKNKGWFK